MAKQTINIGSTDYAGDGESLRSAFDKANQNFTELYNDVATNLASAFDGDYNNLSNAPVLFSEDYADLTNKPTALSDFANDLDYASIVGVAIQNNGLPVLPTQTLDINGSVFGDDSTLLVDGVNGTLHGNLTGNVTTNSIVSTSGNIVIEADNYVIIDSENNGQINIGQASGIGNILLGNRANGTDVSIRGDVTMDAGTTVDFTGATVTGLTVSSSYTDGAGVWLAPQPATLNDAIDRLATAIYNLNGNSAI